MENLNSIELLKINDFYIYGNEENISLSKSLKDVSISDNNDYLNNTLKQKPNVVSFKPKNNNNKKHFIENIIYSIFLLKKYRNSEKYKDIKNYIHENILENYKVNDFFYFFKSINYDHNKNYINSEFFVNTNSDFENFKEEVLLLFKNIKYFNFNVLIEKNKKFSGNDSKFYLIFDNGHYCIYNTWFLFKNSEKRKLLFKTDNLKTLYWYLTNFHY